MTYFIISICFAVVCVALLERAVVASLRRLRERIEKLEKGSVEHDSV